jgi:effector-binding domain-containing protein
MLDKPQIVQTADQPAAVIRLKIPREEIQKVMGAGIQELIATVQAQGVGPAGPVFSHHLRMDPGTFDFEIGVPVKAPVKETERVKNGKLAGRPKVARTVYRGPYEGIGPAWGEFNQILKAQGLEIAGDLWEVYVAGPETGPDASQWQTELNRPLAS